MNDIKVAIELQALAGPAGIEPGEHGGSFCMSRRFALNVEAIVAKQIRKRGEGTATSRVAMSSRRSRRTSDRTRERIVE